MKIQLKRPQTALSLTTTLAIAFFVLSATVLLVSSGLQTFFNFQIQRQAISGQQQLLAQDAAKAVSGFIQEHFSVLETAVRLVNSATASLEAQEQMLERLLGLQHAFRQVVLLDTQNRPTAHASRLSQAASAQFDSRLRDEVLAQLQQEQRYISPVYIDEMTSEPMIIMAVPATNPLGEFQGTIVAEVNLKFMWDLVDQLKVGETGEAYVVDRQGTLLAYSDTARVLRGENVGHLTEVNEFVRNAEAGDLVTGELDNGIAGTAVLGTFVPLGTPDWAVVVELPWQEAYREVILLGMVSIGISLAVALLAGLLGFYIARRLAVSLVNLMDTATRITGGKMELQAVVTGPKEVASLAVAFNSMTAQLRHLLSSLEEQVAARTHRLEIVATLGEHLNAILDLDDLLREVVNQIKQNFGFYHVHVYLLDNKGEKLVVAAGTGEAGAEMKARGHHIPLQAPSSLVARAARTTQVVRVDNVHEAPDWLPNPLLPDTMAEMAVPISLEGRVVGVLDVQENKIGGLDEGDASLLRSLANQVAITIRNARLFQEVETALAEARTAQERYLETAWEKIGRVATESYYHYARPDAPELTEAITTAVQRQAMALSAPAVITVNGQAAHDSGGGEELTAPERPESPAATEPAVLAAPVKLQHKNIGLLQIHPAAENQTWSEDDLVVITAITGELAQVAENLRLFDETRERAGRERTIREITDKLRAAPTLERLIEVASDELGQRLAATFARLELGFAATPGSDDRDGAGLSASAEYN